MILHCVFCAVSDADDSRAIADVCDRLQTLAVSLPGVMSFDHGPNLDFERKSRSHPYGFVIRFADGVALETYASDPRHKALGVELCEVCIDGADGIVVYDLNVG